MSDHNYVNKISLNRQLTLMKRPADGRAGQKVVLSSRPSVTNKIEFVAKRRVNPIDIYFMIDLTKSMETVKNKLATIVTNIKNEIVKTTSDYRHISRHISISRAYPDKLLGMYYLLGRSVRWLSTYTYLTIDLPQRTHLRSNSCSLSDI